jgi:hypothetical protein
MTSAIPGSGHKWLFPTSIVLGVRGGVEIGRFRVWGKCGRSEGRGGGGPGRLGAGERGAREAGKIMRFWGGEGGAVRSDDQENHGAGGAV